MHHKDAPFYIHWNGGAVMVKEGNFFREQGGLKESWGKAWKGIEAKSIEDARRIGQDMHFRGLI